MLSRGGPLKRQARGEHYARAILNFSSTKSFKLNDCQTLNFRAWESTMGKIKKRGIYVDHWSRASLLTSRRFLWPGQELHHPNSGGTEIANIFARFPKTVHIQR
jgi:hypothetical protein